MASANFGHLSSHQPTTIKRINQESLLDGFCWFWLLIGKYTQYVPHKYTKYTSPGGMIWEMFLFQLKKSPQTVPQETSHLRSVSNLSFKGWSNQQLLMDWTSKSSCAKNLSNNCWEFHVWHGKSFFGKITQNEKVVNCHFWRSDSPTKAPLHEDVITVREDSWWQSSCNDTTPALDTVGTAESQIFAHNSIQEITFSKTTWSLP